MAFWPLPREASGIRGRKPSLLCKVSILILPRKVDNIFYIASRCLTRSLSPADDDGSCHLYVATASVYVPGCAVPSPVAIVIENTALPDLSLLPPFTMAV